MRDDHHSWLKEREVLTKGLGVYPYSSNLYLRRATCHEKLGYSDLAASDAYRALLLTDEVFDEEGEYHEQAVKATADVAATGNSNEDTAEADTKSRDAEEIAKAHALQSYEILARTLSDCGDSKSAYDFTQRGLMAFPRTTRLQVLQKNIVETYKEALLRKNRVWRDSDFNPREDLPGSGSARRETYPWNHQEADRSSDATLSFINGEIRKCASKCEVRVTELPLLDGDASYVKSQPRTVKQLGIFTISDVEPYERLLLEASVLTSSTRLHDPLCDACSSQLLPSSPANPLPTCPDCEDIVFCSQACFERARDLYHPAVCGVLDYDIVAKDPSPLAATSALYILLIARTMAMAETQNTHPLDLPQTKYLWGDYSHPDYPAERTLPFSFLDNIAQPLHLLTRLDKNPFAPEVFARYDTWVINTLLAKFRGTANAKMNERTGMPEVAGVHWLWSLANHSCAPNVRWEWEKGGMGFVARGEEQVMKWSAEKGNLNEIKRWRGGIKQGCEVLNHYCDVDMPIQKRREWAVGALGGLCVCERCVWEENEEVGD